VQSAAVGGRIFGGIVLALVTIAGCRQRSLDMYRLASRSECKAYQAKLRSLAGMEVAVGDPKQALDLCQQRVSTEMVDCVMRASSIDEVEACKPSVEIRPPAARRSAEECVRYTEHIREVAEKRVSARATDNLVHAFEHECRGYLTAERYDCVLAAEDAHALARCPP
jgi:hypothetical protein